jgi:ATP/maltotriose-dependent transcriptional regulator MalT
MAREWLGLPITASELQFSLAEAGELAAAMAVDIDDANLSAIVADTEGWPVALHLALTAWERTRSLPPLRLRTREVLFEYLTREVWTQTSAADQSLLHVAALLVPIRPEVIETAGIANAVESLTRLARENPFLQAEPGGTYRLHELFREFLREQQRRDPAALLGVVRNTALALERVAFPADSLRLLVSLRLAAEILELLGRAGYDLIEGGYRDDVTSALRALPRDRQNDPVALALRGYLLKLDGFPDAAEAEMDRAIELDLPASMYVAAAHRLGRIKSSRGNARAAIIIFEKALERADPRSPLVAEIQATLAGSHAQAGELDKARAIIQAAIEGLSSLDSDARARTLHMIAFALYYCGDLTSAESYALHCAQLAEALGLEQVAGNAYSVLYPIALYLHPNTALAAHYAESTGRMGQICGDKVLQAHGFRGMYIIAADRGDDEALEIASQRLATIGQIRAFRDTFPFRRAAAIQLVGANRLPEALRMLTSFGTEGLSKSENALRDSLVGVLLAAKPDRDAASAILGRPLLISAEQDLLNRRSYLLAQVYRALGHWLLGRNLASRRRINLDDECLQERDRILISVVMSLCAMPRATVTGRQIDQLTEPLLAVEMAGHLRFIRTLTAPTTKSIRFTPTEIEVLRAFHGGDTEATVATRLGKSSHTIHGHLREIYRKIGCSTRTEALEYASAGGWLEA